MVSIEMNRIYKKFKIHSAKNNTLKDKFIYFGKNKVNEHWVLKDVSLKITSGKTVGLIGKNGSGKSTLLKILTRIIYPTSGNIQIHGRVSSLLELGAGFHPDFTGRDNVYMNAAILGMSKKEIDQKMNEIIEFSELERFIDNNVRSYSSGMYMRLGFSVAIMVNPDILLIDEVFAVGDASFQKKCIDKLFELKKLGKTIVVVSHSQEIMEKLCDEVAWINQGNLEKYGSPKAVYKLYNSYMNEGNEIKI